MASPDGTAVASVGASERARLRFVITALLLMLSLCCVYYYPHAPDGYLAAAIDGWLRLQAHAAGQLIAVFDPQVVVRGTLISGRFPVQVVKGCSSLDVQALFAAAVLAFPAPTIRKVFGLLFGMGLLTSLNLMRIAGLYFVGAHLSESFDTIHEEVMPLLLLVGSCLAFLVWVHWTRRGLQAHAV